MEVSSSGGSVTARGKAQITELIATALAKGTGT